MTLKRLSDLNRRLAVSSVVVVAIAVLIAFSDNFWMSGVLAIVVAALAAIGVWEYGNLANAKDLHPSSKAMMVAAVCQVLAFYLSVKVINWPQLPIIVIALSIVAFFIIHFRGTENALVHVAVELFGVIYIAVPFGFMLGILYLPAHHVEIFSRQDGRWWLVYLILVTKITDMGGYFVGKLWGKKRLAPVLSPKKTIEGAVAGFCCATIASLAMYYFGHHLAPRSFDLSLFEAIWLGMLIGILGQLGDLAESLLKRDAVVKDSNSLPGLGGILDMVDSLLFTTPIVYFFVRSL